MTGKCTSRVMRFTTARMSMNEGTVVLTKKLILVRQSDA